MTRALGTPAAVETKASICKDLPFCECRASRRAIGVCRIFGTPEVLVFHSGGAFAFGTLERAFAETNALGIPAASDTKASIFNYLLVLEMRSECLAPTARALRASGGTLTSKWQSPSARPGPATAGAPTLASRAL